MKIKTSWMLALLATPMICRADGIPAPTITPGDTWTYINTAETGPNGWRQSHDSIVALRTTADHIYVETRTANSPQAPIESISGLDWSRARNVNGTEQVVSRPLAFPLGTGKQWEVKFTEQQPTARLNSRTYDTRMRVVGHEAIDVPAGHFDAIKIEGEGQWTAELAPTQVAGSTVVHDNNGVTAISHAGGQKAVTTTGRLYKAVWYVPSVNRWVKTVEEYYNPNGTRAQRLSSELESFHSGTAHGGTAPSAAQAPASAVNPATPAS
ncbi:hypothetical protein [Burkholderia gladioli]|uniref:hypothetical protein n=1 Tax=Burkholderia gladioli TaxID=28095 RepID=UPI000CFFFAF0|nr:hypothetical protein [Burkholderia gladioli]PRG57233.1 hypothetical protein C6V06_02875 [Burkholderia gladioli]